MTVRTETPQWTGPARFLPPPEPSMRADGTQHCSGVSHAVAFAGHIFLGCPDIEAIVLLSVDSLADNHLEKNS